MIRSEENNIALLGTEQKQGKRRFKTERFRQIMKATDRSDWFNLIGLMVLLGVLIAGAIYFILL